MKKKILIIMAGILLISLVACHLARIDVAKFDPLVRAASKVKASTGVGLSFIQFAQYLQEYATEVLIIKGKVGNDKEKEILGYFSDALEIYNDSKTIWNAKNNDRVFGGLADYGVTIPEIVITDEISSIVQKYNLTVIKHSNFESISETSIQQLWGQAGILIDTATSSLQHSTR